MLTLGIPASATAAIMLSALQGYGIATGPLLLERHPELVWGLIASLYIANVLLLVLNLPLIGLWVQLLKIRELILFPLIIAFSTLGAYSLSRNVFDVYLMFGIGILGAVLRRYNFPLAPIVLGLVLGKMLETEFRRALIGSRGDWTVLFDRPPRRDYPDHRGRYRVYPASDRLYRTTPSRPECAAAQARRRSGAMTAQ